MELLLVRHGDAAMVAGPDADRPLTNHGETQAEALAAWLATGQWQPEQVLVSPFRRAQATASPLKTLWPAVDFDTSEFLTPDSRIARLVAEIEDRGSQRLLLVSHNPLMSNFLNWLLGDEQSRVMGTATAALLSTDVLAQGCATLMWMRYPPDYTEVFR